jgi:hypothetical protein
MAEAGRLNGPHKMQGPGGMSGQMSPASPALAVDILRLSKLLTKDRSEAPGAYLNALPCTRPTRHIFFASCLRSGLP